MAAEEVAQLLSQAERYVTRQLARLLEEEGCTLCQWRTLRLLADGASHPMSEIAEFALLPAASLTRLIDRMVADDLVSRQTDPRDRRRTLVHLSARGRALQQRLARRIDGQPETVLADTDAVDLAQLGALLGDLVERLRAAPHRPTRAARR